MISIVIGYRKVRNKLRRSRTTSINSRRMMARMVRNDMGLTACLLDDGNECVFQRRLDAFEALHGDTARGNGAAGGGLVGGGDVQRIAEQRDTADGGIVPEGCIGGHEIAALE